MTCAKPVCLPAEIDLWRADLSQSGAIPALERTLAPEELARASRFHREVDRCRYVLARGALRSILASYLQVPAGELVLRSGPNGKPELAGGALRFSLSHSHDLAVYAVTPGPDVGVDVELIRPVVAGELARQLSVQAQRRLRALSEGRRARAFFLAWTRMESCAKAGGEGLAGGADFETLQSYLGPMDAAQGQAGWWLQDFTPRAGYVGTVAAAGARCSLNFLTLDADLNARSGWE